MRKILLFVLALCLLPLAVFAEPSLCAADEDGVGSALAEALIPLTGWQAEPADEAVAAVDRAAADPETAALVSQQALLEALQGYADCEVRTDLQLVLPLGEEPLFLVTSGETAENLGLTDLSSLAAFLAEHPFELTLMRSFEAGAADYAAVQLFNALDLDTETFADLADCLENLAEGDYLLVAPASVITDDLGTVLGPLTGARSARCPDLPSAEECGLPVCLGNVWAVYVAAGEDPAPWLEALRPAAEDARFTEALSDAGLLPLGPDSLVLSELLEAYVAYMTEEGLFFYD